MPYIGGPSFRKIEEAVYHFRQPWVCAGITMTLCLTVRYDTVLNYEVF